MKRYHREHKTDRRNTVCRRQDQLIMTNCRPAAQMWDDTTTDDGVMVENRNRKQVAERVPDLQRGQGRRRRGRIEGGGRRAQWSRHSLPSVLKASGISQRSSDAAAAQQRRSSDAAVITIQRHPAAL